MPKSCLRWEYKAVLRPDQHSQLAPYIVNNHYALFEKYPPRRINNIYFDSLAMNSLNENIEGLSTRKKFRLRWYQPGYSGNFELPNFCFKFSQLEVKGKVDGLGWKRSYPIKKTINLKTIRWAQLRHILLSKLDSEDQLGFLNHGRPILLNSYLRHYYETRNGYCRVTVDTAIKNFRQKPNAAANTTFQDLNTDKVILEFKAEQEHEKHLNKLIQGFPYTIQRHSKYASQLEAEQMEA